MHIAQSYGFCKGECHKRQEVYNNLYEFVLVPFHNVIVYFCTRKAAVRMAQFA